MKSSLKIIASVIALLLCAHTASAQLYIGGQIGVLTKDGAGFNIAPEIGFHINDNISIGAMASYQSNPSSFGLTPFARLHLISILDRLNIFAEANMPVKFGGDYSCLAVYVRPGVAYRIGGNTHLVAQLGNFGFLTVKNGDIRTSDWVGEINTDTINIGVTFGF